MLESKDLSVVEATLDAVLEVGREYLDSDEASEAIAAIEVLAKLLERGTQTDSYTEEIDQWVKDNPQRPSTELLQKAEKVIRRILSPNSELLELWEEQDDEVWKLSLQQLLAATKS